MFQNPNFDWSNLIRFTSAGIEVASYADIRRAVTNRFKEIYGSDIDLATTSADGVYVETLCLMLNNIMQTVKQTYANLDVRVAGGKFLDMLCALSNVSRKPATYSTASLKVTLAAGESDLTTNDLSFLDGNGNEWKMTSASSITFKAGVTQEILVACTTPGPVKAEAGWINRPLSVERIMTVVQEDPADTGSFEETDSELRSRRNQSLGISGVTVLESVQGALLALSGIDDVLIYNAAGKEITCKDGTSLPVHYVYPIIRQRANVDIDDSTIGELIYNKLTPGISTYNATGAKAGVIHEYTITDENTGVVQHVYWKKASPVHPEITITITPKENFAGMTDGTPASIADSVIEYCNQLNLSADLIYENLYEVIRGADPLFRGKTTFTISNIQVDGEDDFTNTDTYYDYSTFTYNSSNNTIIIK